MWIKVGDQPEINVEDIAQNLEYLSESSSPAIANTYTDSAGIDGSQYNYSTFSRNVVTANFVLHFSTWYSFELAKHDIYRIFSTKQVIRIRTDSSPAVVRYVRSAPFEIKPISDGSHDATFSIPFENPSGYLYSLVNSDILKEYGQNAWQYGENLPNGKDLQYQFVDQTQLSVYNASDIPIDPYFQRHELKIIIKHSGGGFTLENKTTGDVYEYHGNMNSNDTLMIDGINTYLNGKLNDNQTNYSYLSLAIGWNDIRVAGTADMDITFSFPFIYLG